MTFGYPADDRGASGLPLLEAIATGTPTVAPSRVAFIETYGPAAD